MTLRVLSALLFLSACTGDPKPGDDSGAESGAVDADGDGFEVNDDCNDDDGAINPDAVEACDAIDNDCDGGVDEDAADESTWYGDADGDGYGGTLSIEACSAPIGFVAGDGDCDDGDAAAYPGAEEDCSDAADKNCDGSVGYADADDDGVPACEDCDDGDATALPGGVEVCDGVDNDCDGTADDSTADADGDGALACADCDDADATAYPGATEACDGDDEDCDGEVDEAGATGEATWYADTDGDGFGNASRAATACDAMFGYVADATDCNDAAGDVNPGADEVCGTLGVDEDCDGAVDDEDSSLDASTGSTFYLDYDADGFGGATIRTQACVLPTYYASNAADCDDTDPATNPDGTEVCDAADADEDCDGLSDDADTATGQQSFYVDLDMDGFGDSGNVVMACDIPAGTVENAEDCDDGDEAVNPDATEVCDAADVDEDCDGAADDLDIATGEGSFYYDADGDGYGDATIATSACDATGTWVGDATDCDDDDDAVHPGATEEVGNEHDEDCDGTEQCYLDGDDDGYLSSAPGVILSADMDCEDAMEGSATTPAGDCDDADATSSPANTESCNLADCDETTASTTWYADVDTDTYGDPADSLQACSAPAGYVTNALDCDDAEATVNGAATELYGNTVDEDCDGMSSPSRSYCTPNVPTTWASVDAALAGGATEICLDVGTFSASSTVNVPVSGQGMDATTLVGDISGNATDLTLDGDAAGRTSHTLTRVHALGEVSTFCDSSSGGFRGPEVLVYESILEGGVAVTAYMINLRGTCSASLYNTHISGGHSGYGIYVSANGAAAYAYPGFATVTCTNCTIVGASTGAYYAYSQYYGVATLTLNNSVYEEGAPYTSSYYSTTTVTTTTSSTDTSLLDTSTTPPTPTGALIDGGDTTAGTTTDFWANPRTGAPDLGAVEAP